MTVAHHVRYLWYLLAGASALPAVRLGKNWWDDDYRRDGLARTEGEVELPRHLLVAALVRQYASGGAVLDIGCGTGGLTTPLRAFFSGTPLHYTGLDYADLALQQAAARAAVDVPSARDHSVQFVQADFDAYEPTGHFDAIVFSESLYYAPDPARTVRRYLGALRAGGVLIVSMWRRPGRGRVRRALGGALRERSRSRLTVPRRPSWDIVVYSRE